MVDEMAYLNEVLHEKEFEGKMLNA